MDDLESLYDQLDAYAETIRSRDKRIAELEAQIASAAQTRQKSMDNEDLPMRALYEDACISANKNALDAERYRWWRNWVFRAGNDGLPTCTYLADVEEPVDIDFAIDAAILSTAQPASGSAHAD